MKRENAVTRAGAHVWTGSILILSSFTPFSALAIRGDYLPASELPKYACQIHVDKIVETYTPTYENYRANGLPPMVRETPPMSMCTASLIRPNTILTAAHCFVGNNEQTVTKGLFPYRYDESGKMIPGCESTNWLSDPKCKWRKQRGIGQMKWAGINVVCPTKDGKTESRPLTEFGGYPNPLFATDTYPDSVSSRNYDITVWNFEDPLLNTPVVPLELDFKNVYSTAMDRGTSCRAFGYGLDNHDESGILHGANLPIVSGFDSYLKSTTMVDGAPTLPSMGETAPGDSGGPLVCKDENGIDRQYGVTSRGTAEGVDPSSGPDVDPSVINGYSNHLKPELITPAAEVADLYVPGGRGRKTYTSSTAGPSSKRGLLPTGSSKPSLPPIGASGDGRESIFALPSFNAGWIHRVLEEAPVVRPAEKQWWYEFTYPYHRDEVLLLQNKIYDCLTKTKIEMNREDWDDFMKQYKSLLSDCNVVDHEYQQYQDGGLYRAKIRPIHYRLKELYQSCERFARGGGIGIPTRDNPGNY